MRIYLKTIRFLIFKTIRFIMVTYSVIEVIIKNNIIFTPEEILMKIRDNKGSLNIQYFKISLLNLDNEYKLIIKFTDIIITVQQFNIFISLLNNILNSIISKSRFYIVRSVEV